MFYFVTRLHDQFSVGFWTDADPVHTRRHINRSVGFNRNFKFALVQFLNERFI